VWLCTCTELPDSGPAVVIKFSLAICRQLFYLYCIVSVVNSNFVTAYVNITVRVDQVAKVFKVRRFVSSVDLSFSSISVANYLSGLSTFNFCLLFPCCCCFILSFGVVLCHYVMVKYN